MWKCVDAELQWQIHCFPYVELSDVPRLQQVEKKSCRMAEESRTNNRDVTVTSPTTSGWVCPILRSFTMSMINKNFDKKIIICTFQFPHYILFWKAYDAMSGIFIATFSGRTWQMPKWTNHQCWQWSNRQMTMRSTNKYFK
jgi:hypothetical protein